MSPRRKKISRKLYDSPATMLLLLAGGFALFSVLFRYEVPKVNAAEHKTGRLVLLPVPEDSVQAQWLEIHDPARIARGGELPEPAERSVPGASKPEPVVPLKSPSAVEPEAMNRQEIPAALPPVFRPETGTGLRFKAIAPEAYPRILVNKEKSAGILPEALLKQAASVNAGTVELRFSQGVLPGELRSAVVCSSGSARLDQALIQYFGKQTFKELPAHIRVIWDIAGEVKK